MGKTGKQLPYCGCYGNRKNRGPIHLYLKKSGFKGLPGFPDVGEKSEMDSCRQESGEHLTA